MSSSKHLYAVILAGGSGTRFWPLSRQQKPKQLLSIVGSRTLLQETLLRLRGRVSPQNIYIVGSREHKGQIPRQVNGFKIPSQNILFEPVGKNTAPAIGWTAANIARRDPNAIIGVFPSDHLILNNTKFLKNLDEAVRLAQKGFLVTFGIVPTRPETGYGYLKVKSFRLNGQPITLVERFIEKPSAQRAKIFFQSSQYLWNSGMFVWKAEVILQELQKFLPAVYRAVKNGTVSAASWKQLPSISIDYGILEKSSRVATVPSKDIGWSDLGSWEALTEVVKKDRNGNKTHGDVIALDCRNTLVHGHKRLVAAIGLKDMVIVDTSDALLVCCASESQKVREVVEILRKRNRYS